MWMVDLTTTKHARYKGCINNPCGLDRPQHQIPLGYTLRTASMRPLTCNLL